MSFNKTTIFFISAFCVLLVLLVFFNQSDSGFIDSIVPELIGFCLEGIFFIGLFSVLQHRREVNKRKQLSLSLRGFLEVFLSELNDGILCADYQSEALSEEIKDSQERIDSLATNIKNCSINEEAINALHQLSQDEVGALENLLPVAAELSADHMIVWHKILEQVKNLGKLECRDHSNTVIIRLLDTIKKFDLLPV